MNNFKYNTVFNRIRVFIRELHSFLILWSTQSLSVLGSSMTNFALVVWTYQEQGSALTTALLSVCSYAPYVVMSIFAGALSDKWNKKITMLASDTFAAMCTVCVLVLLETGRLEIWHLYLLNGLNGLMGTVQAPAADVTITLLTPEKYYQKVSGMRSFSNSLTNILSPILATTLLAALGLKAVIWFDLTSFAIAFTALAGFVKIPRIGKTCGEKGAASEGKESVFQSAGQGLDYLKKNRGILDLMLFLAAINFTASAYEAALPAMILSKFSVGTATGWIGAAGGAGLGTMSGEAALAAVNGAAGIAMVIGSILASVMPEPKSRVRVICNTLLISMSTENFLLALGSAVPVWCLGAVTGWLVVPVMSANMDVLFRSYIPVEMQGRVYAARNTFQFFTIPIGYFAGGILVDKVFEPFMAGQAAQNLWCRLFGFGKGSGAALLFMVLGFLGVATCLYFRKDRHIWELEK